MSLALWTSITTAVAIYLWIYRKIALENLIFCIGRRTPRKIRREYQEAFDLLGLKMSPEYLAGIKYGGTFFSGALSLIFFLAGSKFIGFVCALVTLIAWVYPDKWIEDLEKKREEEINREFPVMVTLIKVYSHASDLYQALNIVRGALKGELRRQLDILASELTVFPLKDVLERFAYRCKSPIINNFVSVILFGIQTGSNVDEILDTFAKRSYEVRVNEIKRKIKAQPIILSVLPAVMMFALVLLFVFPMYANIIDKLRTF